MKFFCIIFAFLFISLLNIKIGYSQDDDGDIKMSQAEWHLKRDQYAVSAIELLKRLEKLDSTIDSLKKINAQDEKLVIEGCDERLLQLVGTNKENYEDFKRKFDEAETKIGSKTGTPADIRTMYIDEITNSKIRCLPEFSDRYIQLKKNLSQWEGLQNKEPVKNIEGNYLVVKGDCLWRISAQKYNNPYLWPAIWDANKTGIVNSNEFYERKLKSISNPNLIYPGQVLKIPKMPDIKNKKEK